MGAIDTTANRVSTYDSQGNSTASTASSTTGAGGATTPPTESETVEEGYEQFAQETNGNSNFDQNTWNTYAQQLGAKVGQDGGSLNATAVDQAGTAEKDATAAAGDTTSGPAGQHMLPPGTNLKFEDGSNYTVKPGDTISYESLQQYMPKTQVAPPDNAQSFQSVSDPTNVLAPGNQPGATGGTASTGTGTGTGTGSTGTTGSSGGGGGHHSDYYANLYRSDSLHNPNGLYSAQNMAKAMEGTEDSQNGGDDNDDDTKKTGAAKGKH